jgi:hypothetical protein
MAVSQGVGSSDQLSTKQSSARGSASATLSRLTNNSALGRIDLEVNNPKLSQSNQDSA